MAYLYRHIRLDTNEPFYIGISSDNTYMRSISKDSRNAYWVNITKKTKYIVEIILDELTWEEACVKEIEFIKLYGRKDLKKGTLCNLTDGGEGNNNYSETTRKKISEKIKNNKERGKKISIANRGISKNKGIKFTEKHKEKIKANRKHLIGRKNIWFEKPINQYDLEGNLIKEWPSQKKAALYFGKNKSDNIGAVCRGKQKTAFGFKWKYK